LQIILINVNIMATRMLKVLKNKVTQMIQGSNN